MRVLSRRRDRRRARCLRAAACPPSARAGARCWDGAAASGGFGLGHQPERAQGLRSGQAIDFEAGIRGLLGALKVDHRLARRRAEHAALVGDRVAPRAQGILQSGDGRAALVGPSSVAHRQMIAACSLRQRRRGFGRVWGRRGVGFSTARRSWASLFRTRRATGAQSRLDSERSARDRVRVTSPSASKFHCAFLPEAQIARRGLRASGPGAERARRGGAKGEVENRMA